MSDPLNINAASLRAFRPSYAALMNDLKSRASVFLQDQLVEVLRDETNQRKHTLYQIKFKTPVFVAVIGNASPGTTPSLATTDEFAVGSGGPYTLSEEPNGQLLVVFFDGVEQPSSNYSVSGNTLTLDMGVDPQLFDTVRVSYTYDPV